MQWYKRDPDKALAGMAELTLEERGAYNTIIDALYARNGVLPDDDIVLRRLMGCHGNKWRAIKTALLARGKIWVTADGNLSAKRVDLTLQDREKRAGKPRETVEKRSRNGREISKNVNEINETSRQNKEVRDKKEERKKKEEGVLFDLENSRIPAMTHRATGTDVLTTLLSVLDREHAEAILAHRQKKRSPLTPLAAHLLVKQFAKCRDPNAAAEEMVLRGWQSFKAEWAPDIGRKQSCPIAR